MKAITLESYCFKVYDKLNGDEFLGWFPTHPDSVVYRYSVWGKLSDTTVGFKDNNSYNPTKSNCVTYIKVIESEVLIHYNTNQIGSIKLSIFNNLGSLVYSDIKESLQSCNFLKINMRNLPSGAYYAVINSEGNICYCNFIYIK